MKVKDFISVDPLAESADPAIGLELELENCHPAIGTDPTPLVNGVRLAHGILAHCDGSLRNGGIELVTPPIRAQLIDTSVDYLCALANAQGWVTSNRAGIHVHVDVQSLTLEQLLNVLKVYSLAEPVLFNYASAGREGSIYCKAWHEIDVANLREFVSNTNEMIAGNAREFVRMDTRWLGLNLNSCRKYGTLEFRHLRSSIDAGYIKRWIKILLSLRSCGAAVGASVPEITQEYLSTISPDEFLTHVFGRDGALLSYPEYNSYFYNRAVPLCTELFFPTREAVGWRNLKTKKRPHSGYVKFAKGKLESNPRLDEQNPSLRLFNEYLVRTQRMADLPHHAALRLFDRTAFWNEVATDTVAITPTPEE